MLATHCPCCGHDNLVGTAFCAGCGVPLHLKPCPRCDKVHELAAEVCEGCGAAFPPLERSGQPAVDTAASANLGAKARGSTADIAANRAFPLILIAVVAGGLPVLWMNRAHLPVPTTWRLGEAPMTAGVQTAAVAGDVVAPERLPSSPLPGKAGGDANRLAQPTAVHASPVGAKLAPNSALKGERVHQNRGVRPPTAPANEASTAPPDCTEAVDALGLCASTRRPE